MATDNGHRGVTIERISAGRFVARNERGGQVEFGTGSAAELSPVDLLLAAVGGCTALDVDAVTSRRAEPERFEVAIDAQKVRDELGNHLTDIRVTFLVRFPEGGQGDEARAVLPEIARRSHDKLCTVSRTIEIGTEIGTTIA
jgi:putative redox protein